MTTATAEAVKIERTMRVAAPRSKVWRALTSASAFKTWFGVAFTGELAEGARIEMTSLHKGACDGVQFWMQVERMEPEHLFAWTWDPGAPEPDVDYEKEPKTRVEFTLEEQAGETLVTVTETGFERFSADRRAKLFAGNSRGWEAQMENLARYAGQRE